MLLHDKNCTTLYRTTIYLSIYLPSKKMKTWLTYKQVYTRHLVVFLWRQGIMTENREYFFAWKIYPNSLEFAIEMHTNWFKKVLFMNISRYSEVTSLHSTDLDGSRQYLMGAWQPPQTGTLIPGCCCCRTPRPCFGSDLRFHCFCKDLKDLFAERIRCVQRPHSRSQVPGCAVGWIAFRWKKEQEQALRSSIRSDRSCCCCCCR